MSEILEETNNCAKRRLCDVLELFYSKDKFRPAMQSAFKQNGKVYATDAYTAICVDEKHLDFEIVNEFQDKAPNIEKVYPEENTSRTLNVSIADFEKFMTEDEIKYLGEDISCETCDGEGEVEWEFEHWTKDFECPRCHGTGLSHKALEVKTGNKTLGSHKVKIGDAFFDIRKFFKLIRVQQILGGEIELIHVPEKPTGTHLFKVGICKIIIMPTADSDGEVLNLA
ncbi:hypothetical protein [Flavobacterium mekongense]|uniref:hypothetical protein n=1 Tax=Flavobacterium mekongense TaxID=3379707 RepID=UPI0039996249